MTTTQVILCGYALAASITFLVVARSLVSYEDRLAKGDVGEEERREVEFYRRVLPFTFWAAAAFLALLWPLTWYGLATGKGRS